MVGPKPPRYQQSTRAVNKSTVSICANKKLLSKITDLKIKVLPGNTYIIQRSQAKVLYFLVVIVTNGQQSGCAMWIVFTELKEISMI